MWSEVRVGGLLRKWGWVCQRDQGGDEVAVVSQCYKGTGWDWGTKTWQGFEAKPDSVCPPHSPESTRDR